MKQSRGSKPPGLVVMSKIVKKYAGMVPVHPELKTVTDFVGLPHGSIISVTGHDFELFEFNASRGVFVTLRDETLNVAPDELLDEYVPVRLVWVP